MALSDTSTATARVYIAAFASLSGSERVERSISMAEEAKTVTLAGIRHRNQDYNEQQVHHAWLVQLHGPEIAKLLT